MDTWILRSETSLRADLHNSAGNTFIPIRTGHLKPNCHLVPLILEKTAFYRHVGSLRGASSSLFPSPSHARCLFLSSYRDLLKLGSSLDVTLVSLLPEKPLFWCSGVKGGDLCFTFQFIPWKKLYHRYLMKEDVALCTVEQILQDFAITKQHGGAVLGLIR